MQLRHADGPRGRGRGYTHHDTKGFTVRDTSLLRHLSLGAPALGSPL